MTDQDHDQYGSPTGAPPPTFPPTGAASPPSAGTAPAQTSQTGGAESAKDEAEQVAHRAAGGVQDVADVAAEKAGDVVQTAQEQVKETAAEAKDQLRGLYEQGRQQVGEQAGVQQQRLAGGMRSVSSELSSMARSSEEPGLATAVARQLADGLGQAGDWLEQREPAQVLQEVSRYARRHPVAFMAIAAGVGLLAGRVARSAKDTAGDAPPATAGTDRPSTGQHTTVTPEHGAGATSGGLHEGPAVTDGPAPSAADAARPPATTYPDERS